MKPCPLSRELIRKKLRNDDSFSARVYLALMDVPKGKVTTYGELAKAVCCGSARAIGQALNRNPYAPVVPCHRVVMADGKLGGFAFGLAKKKQLLSSEGLVCKDGAVLQFKDKLYQCA